MADMDEVSGSKEGNLMTRAIFAAFTATFMLACVSYPMAPVITGEVDFEHDRYAETGHAHHTCNVPPGHLPPLGECRVWYPDLPPGQQPPPGDCYELRHHVPPGTCLVHGE